VIMSAASVSSRPRVHWPSTGHIALQPIPGNGNVVPFGSALGPPPGSCAQRDHGLRHRHV